MYKIYINNILSIILLNACLIVAKPAFCDIADQENKSSESIVVLIIGNGNYPSPLTRLSNPENDADDIKKAFESIKPTPKIIFRKNANRDDMDDAVSEFIEALNEKTVGVFYYSGHGAQTAKENYLFPIKSIRNYTQLNAKGYPLSTLLDLIRDTNSPLALVLLDACRETVTKGVKGIKTTSFGLAPAVSPPGTILSFATSPGYTVDDRPEERNSLYTSALLKHINSGRDIETILKLVGREVYSENPTQIPWINSSFYGDRYCFGDCENTQKSQFNAFSSIETLQTIEEQNDMIAISKNIDAKGAFERLVKRGKLLNSIHLFAADFAHAIATNAILPNSVLQYSSLYQADVSFSDFTKADLLCSTLAEANFSTAKLEGARFSGADVTRTNFKNTNLKKDQLKDTCIVRENSSGSALPITDFPVSDADFTECAPLVTNKRQCKVDYSTF